MEPNELEGLTPQELMDKLQMEHLYILMPVYGPPVPGKTYLHGDPEIWKRIYRVPMHEKDA